MTPSSFYFYDSPEFAATLNAVGTLVFSTSLDGIVRSFNSTAERWLGWQSTEVVGQHTPVLWHDAAELAARASELSRIRGRLVRPDIEVLAALADDDASEHRVWTMVCRDDSVFLARLVMQSLRDREGQTVGYVGTALALSSPEQAGADHMRRLGTPDAHLGDSGSSHAPVRDRTIESDDSMAGIIAGVTQLKRADDRMHFQSRVLELLVSNSGLPQLLDGIARYVQQESPATLCSILLMADDGIRLLHGAAPNLPSFYNQAIDGVQVGEAVGSCGTAAYLKQRIVAEDVQTHPAWTSFRGLAERANLRSCWSEPILAADGQVLGTFAMYHREPSVPNAADIERIEWASGFTRLAIELAKGRRPKPNVP